MKCARLSAEGVVPKIRCESSANAQGEDQQMLWVTFSSSGYGSLLLNWTAHVKRLGVPYLVIALDPKAAALSEEEDVIFLLHDSQVGKG